MAHAPDLRDLKDKANQLTLKGQHQKALEVYQQIARGEPHEPRWLLKIAECWRALGSIPAAVRGYEEAARAYRKVGFELKATAAERVAIQLRPPPPPPPAAPTPAPTAAPAPAPAVALRPMAGTPVPQTFTSGDEGPQTHLEIPVAAAAAARANPPPSGVRSSRGDTTEPHATAHAAAESEASEAAPVGVAPADDAREEQGETMFGFAAAARPSARPAAPPVRPARGVDERSRTPTLDSIELSEHFPVRASETPSAGMVDVLIDDVVVLDDAGYEELSTDALIEDASLSLMPVPLGAAGRMIEQIELPSPEPSVAAALVVPSPDAALFALTDAPGSAAALPLPDAIDVDVGVRLPAPTEPLPLPEAREPSAIFDPSVGASAGMIPLPAPPPPLDRQRARGLPLIGALPEAELAGFLRRIEHLEIPAGAMVIREGEPADRVYLVVTGELLASSGSPPRPLARMGEHAFFGEMALLRDAPRTANVVALGDCELLALPSDLILEICDRHPSVLSVLMQSLRARLISTLTGTSPLFSGLPPEYRNQIVALFRVREIGPGVAFVREGQRTDGLYLLLAGRAEVTSGGQYVTSLHACDVVGEMSLLSHGAAQATVTSVTRMIALVLPVAQFSDLVVTYPPILEQLATLSDVRAQQLQSVRESTTPALATARRP